MQNYQQEFIQFAIDAGALSFGEFTLKSGRISPYFFNAGCFNSGERLSKLGNFYADAIMQSGVTFDSLFGPAYKGIPLVSAVAIALHQKYALDIPWTFNRKEAKDHGEGGQLVGAGLTGKVLVIDDVITAGTAIRESLGLIQSSGATLAAVCVSIDREERGLYERSAIQEFEQEHDAQVIAIAKLTTLIEFLRAVPGQADHLQKVAAYRDEYGVVFS